MWTQKGKRGDTGGQGDEEAASLDMQGVRSDFHPGWFTILDNILIVGKLDGGEEQAGRPHPYPGGLLDGGGGGFEKKCGGGHCQGATVVIQMLREVCCDRQSARQENL